MRDYGKVHTSFWTSQNIRSMSDDGRSLALYLLTCPHGTIAGVFRIPDGYASEDLQWEPERVAKGFAELFRNGFASRCEITKWVWITKHFEWNPPENPNQKKAASKVASQIPDDCSWKQEYITVCAGFIGVEIQQNNNPSQTVRKPLLNQEQEQEQEQDKSSPTNVGLVGSKPADESDDGKVRPILPTCPHQKIIALYGEVLPEQPQPRTWEGQRAKNLATRWRWLMTASKRSGQRYATNEAEGVAFFERMFRHMRTSDFLMRQWSNWDLGWIVKAENFEKIIAGNYDNRAEGQA